MLKTTVKHACGHYCTYLYISFAGTLKEHEDRLRNIPKCPDCDYNWVYEQKQNKAISQRKLTKKINKACLGNTSHLQNKKEIKE